MVDFVFADNYKYCFDTSLNCWVPWGVIHEEAFSRMYLHPKTPTTGAILMKNGLGFGKLKLTNSEKTAWSSNQVSYCCLKQLSSQEEKFSTLVASQFSWLEHRTAIARSRVQIPLKS